MLNQIEQWKKDEAAVFEGWDFSYIKKRYEEEKPDWNYKELAEELINESSSLLDVATGGGEFLSSLAPLPSHTIAIEGYHPNVAVANKNLESLGVEVLEANETQNLPFHDGTFDLILNRQGGLNIPETFRILKNGGNFLTQQVGGDNLFDLMSIFNSKSKWPDNILDIVEKKMHDVGFEIEKSKEWRGKVRFFDVGALVYFLKAIPWIVTNFSVNSHLKYLEKLQENLKTKGRLEFTYTRFLIHAKKL